MSVEGRLLIDLDRTPDGSGRASIASSRPLGITRVLAGGRAHDVVKTIPLLFNICGVAQGSAAVAACERALGISVSPRTQQVRKALVLLEMLREHMVRAAMDWPSFLGLSPRPDEMLRVMRLFTMARRAIDPVARAFTIGVDLTEACAALQPSLAEAEQLLRDLVLTEPLHQWHKRTTRADLDDWCEAGRTPAQKLVRTVIDRAWADAGSAPLNMLPDLPEQEIASHLFGSESAAFVAAPEWDGAACETSVLSRQVEHPLIKDTMRAHGAGLLARLTARLVEMAELPGQISDVFCADDGFPSPPARLLKGRGIAHVEAARGRLVHGVEIADEVVQRYAILAPTEWNFHSAGAAAQGLAEIAVRDGDVHALASLFVSSVDPCVGYEVRVH